MTVEDSNTKNTTGSGTEDQLTNEATYTTAGVRVLVIDGNDLVAGDIIHVYSKEKVLTGGTVRVGALDEWIIGDDVVNADSKIIEFDPISSGFGAGFYVAQFAGTSSLPWKVLKA
jgi:hypothetical protein